MKIRLVTIPAVLLATAMLAAPSFACAQSASPIPMQTAPPATPSAKRTPQQPVAWASLSEQQQRMLAPVESQWQRLHPARQQQLAEHASRWASLPPQRQQQIHERLTRWANMSPQQRQQLRENVRAFRNLTPEQRAKVRTAFEHFNNLPPAERKTLRERWRAMPPAQRMRWANEHADKSAHPPAQHQR